MAQRLLILSNVSFLAAGICLIIALIFFFRFRIFFIIGELSGRNAKKSIEQMRKFNEQSGNKSYRASGQNKQRGKLTETMQETKEGQPQRVVGREETGLLEKAEDGMRPDEEETEQLIDAKETEALDNVPAAEERKEQGLHIEMLKEVMLVHTEEQMW